MKTTIEIADSVLDDARRIAAREAVTLRSLVEAGLRSEIARRKRAGQAFRLRRATFKGNGMRTELAAASWDQLRELAYDGRGG